MRELVSGAVQTRAVTDPLSAVLAQCHGLGVARVGIVSPYIASVAEPIRAAFEAAGVTVPDTLSFGEQVEAKVARIAPRSIADAARALAHRSMLDAVLLSCTNLRTLDILGPLSEELGLPVLSSNQCLAAHMAALAKVTLKTHDLPLEQWSDQLSALCPDITPILSTWSALSCRSSSFPMLLRGRPNGR